MIRDFHIPFNVAMDELPLVQAFALAAWNTESNPWSRVDRVTDGYIAQERFRNKQ